MSAPCAFYSYAFEFLLFAIMCIPDTTAHTPSDPFAQVTDHTSHWIHCTEVNELTPRQGLPSPFNIKMSCPQTAVVTRPASTQKCSPTEIFDGVVGCNILCNQFVEKARLPAATGDAPSCSLHLCLASIYSEGDLCSTRHHAQRKHCPPCVLFRGLVRTSGNLSDCSVPSLNLAKPCTG